MTATPGTERAAASPPWEADEILVGFTHALRAAGLPVTGDRTQGFLRAAAELGLDDARATYRAGRATLCAGPDDLRRYDEVFAAWFDPAAGLPRRRPRERRLPPVQMASLEQDPTGTEGTEGTGTPLRAAASRTEVLRHRDVAALDSAERRTLAELFELLRPVLPRRRGRRPRPWHRGGLDARRTLRATLRNAGEATRPLHRRRPDRVRRLVLLVDVSGSMAPYADALLRLAHRFARSSPEVEVFTVGTRVTRVSRALQHREPDRALVAVGDCVPDWSGGTRLGESLRYFLDRWGSSGMARGAVVVLFSDGWERGDTTLLGEQCARLHRVAHRVVWVNPHRGKSGYQPVQAGVVAALPHVDDFVAGHSLATFEELLEVVARA